MTLLSIAFPALLLFAACIGYGMLVMALLRKFFADLPILFRICVAYFLGQSLLVCLFAFLAIGGAFVHLAVVWVAILGAIALIFFLQIYRGDISEAVATVRKSWRMAAPSWCLLTMMAVVLYIYGLSTMGRQLEGDAAAFYLAASKLVAHTGRLEIVPGYENFSSVIMTGELLYSAVTILGAPGTSARFYEWINFLPLVAAIYSVARYCCLSRRAAFLVMVMTMTSSALVGQWGGGKTDSFAVGPALIGVWFALASWVSDRRISYVAISGLFCGFAVIAKLSYLVALLPVAMLLVFWHDVGNSLLELRAAAWVPLLRRIRGVAYVSLPFFIFFAIGLAPYAIKNFILFHAPFGDVAASNAGAAWFSGPTIRRLVLTYPLALTFGRYWGQLGTVSPLILACLPLFVLLPRDQRRWNSPLVAVSVSALISLLIWIILLPSMIMPRYIMAVLLLFAIPAAAAAAHVSRERSVLAAVVISAITLVIATLPGQVHSRSAAFQPKLALAYFRTGFEEPMFVGDPYVATTNAVNRAAQQNDRVLLLDYPRIWLRDDLLISVSRGLETGEALSLLQQRSVAFWGFLQNGGFNFIILNMVKAADLAALIKIKPADVEVCEIKAYGGILAYQIGSACRICPNGDRIGLHAPFEKLAPDGFGFSVKIPDLVAVADTQQLPFYSPMAICEGEFRLGPGHASAADIRSIGRGQFSHFEDTLLFSASDNSDPNTNGRSYTTVRPR